MNNKNYYFDFDLINYLHLNHNKKYTLNYIINCILEKCVYNNKTIDIKFNNLKVFFNCLFF